MSVPIGELVLQVECPCGAKIGESCGDRPQVVEPMVLTRAGRMYGVRMSRMAALRRVHARHVVDASVA